MIDLETDLSLQCSYENEFQLFKFKKKTEDILIKKEQRVKITMNGSPKTREFKYKIERLMRLIYYVR